MKTELKAWLAANTVTATPAPDNSDDNPCPQYLNSLNRLVREEEKNR